jgi:hypothetical protein
LSKNTHLDFPTFPSIICTSLNSCFSCKQLLELRNYSCSTSPLGNNVTNAAGINVFAAHLQLLNYYSLAAILYIPCLRICPLSLQQVQTLDKKPTLSSLEDIHLCLLAVCQKSMVKSAAVNCARYLTKKLK